MEWTDPPQKVTPDWTEVAAQARSRPGIWLLVGQNLRDSLYGAIRQNRIAALRKDRGFRAVSRNNTRIPGQQRTSDLYLMYDPDLDQER